MKCKDDFGAFYAEPVNKLDVARIEGLYGHTNLREMYDMVVKKKQNLNLWLNLPLKQPKQKFVITKHKGKGRPKKVKGYQ